MSEVISPRSFRVCGGCGRKEGKKTPCIHGHGHHPESSAHLDLGSLSFPYSRSALLTISVSLSLHPSLSHPRHRQDQTRPHLARLAFVTPRPTDTSPSHFRPAYLLFLSTSPIAIIITTLFVVANTNTDRLFESVPIAEKVQRKYFRKKIDRELITFLSYPSLATTRI